MTTTPLSESDWNLWHSWMEAQRLVVEEVDRSLQEAVGISKAEFSVLRTLGNAAGSTLRVGELGAALRWEKSRVSHLLTRMEGRGLVERIEDGAAGRRTAVALSRSGRSTATAALRVHEDSVRRLFVERLEPGQAAVIRAWSEQVIAASSRPG